MYFSTVAIATQGFGEVYPLSTCAKSLIIVDSLSGVVTIGLFLISVALLKSKIDDADAEVRKRSAERKYSEIIKLSQHYSVLKLTLEDYYKNTIMITTPTSRRREAKEYNPDFEFQDLCDLFGPTLRTTDALYEPAINYYYRSQRELY